MKTMSSPTSLVSPARGLLAAVLVLTLAACASSRGLQPQGRLLDADNLQSSRSLAGTPLSAAGFPAADWWRAFADPQLDALIDEALRGSPSLEAADARLRQAQAHAASSNAERKPSLSLSPGYTGMRLPESMAGDEIGGHYMGSVQAVANFSYGVDLWGGKRAAWEAAVDSGHAAAVDAQAARLDLAAAIVQGYVQLAHAGQLALPVSTVNCRCSRHRHGCPPRNSSNWPHSSRSMCRAMRWPRCLAKGRTAAWTSRFRMN